MVTHLKQPWRRYGSYMEHIWDKSDIPPKQICLNHKETGVP